MGSRAQKQISGTPKQSRLHLFWNTMEYIMAKWQWLRQITMETADDFGTSELWELLLHALKQVWRTWSMEFWCGWSFFEMTFLLGINKDSSHRSEHLCYWQILMSSIGSGSSPCSKLLSGLLPLPFLWKALVTESSLGGLCEAAGQ